MVNISKNIEKILIKKNMSWYQLSKQTGIPESSLADYRHRRKKDITLNAAILIANALETDLNTLVKTNEN